MDFKLTNADAATLGKLFCEAAMFASTEQSRPVITGVLFEQDEAGDLKLTATDSFVLGTFTTHTPVDAVKLIIEAKPLDAIGKALSKLKPAGYQDTALRVSFTFDSDSLTVSADEWTLKARIIQGEFPNYRQLMPTGDSTADSWPALNTTYLALFGKLLLARPAPKRGKSAYFGLRFECFGELKPVRFTGKSDDCEFVGLLMPVRVK